LTGIREKTALVRADRLSEGLVLIHPFVAGELACGNPERRAAILSALHALPGVKVASDTEVVEPIDRRRLWGRGPGWVDMHLLASALLSHRGFRTPDRKPGEAAKALGLKV
jgi:hypothetical protein